MPEGRKISSPELSEDNSINGGADGDATGILSGVKGSISMGKVTEGGELNLATRAQSKVRVAAREAKKEEVSVAVV